jgi:HEAT repeat protein
MPRVYSPGAKYGLPVHGVFAVRKTCFLLLGMFCLTIVAAQSDGLSAAEDAGDELVQMIISLVSDKDRDMRTVGLQQVREQAKGPAATRRFAALLPKLPADAQAGLLDALGDRGDKAARPAVLEMLKSQQEQVRAAALRALGPLGETAYVPLLARALAAPAAPEKTAARASLIRLRGQDVNGAIVAESQREKPEIRAELLGVLAGRGATESIPIILEAAADADAAVRAAALGALRVLADPGQTAALVKLLKAAKEGPEQLKTEQALQAVCTRGREACTDAILAGLADAGPPAYAALLRGLARSGGGKALAAIVSATKDQRPAVRGEAIRLLANWPDAAAIPPLRAIAKQAESLGQNAVAVQGLIRLASPLKDRPADLALLSEAMKLAKRPEEKRMVLGVLGGLATPESLSLVTAAMDDPVLMDEACLAAVLIAGNATGMDRAKRRAVLQQAGAKAKDPEIRQRAQKTLESLGSS